METKPVRNQTVIQPDKNLFSETQNTKKSKKTDGALGVESKETFTIDPASANVDISVSPEAKSRLEAMKKAKEIAQNTSDVRQDRVAELKAKIQSGNYQVDSGKVADGLLREAILERLATAKER